jgi:hypothetical protein
VRLAALVTALTLAGTAHAAVAQRPPVSAPCADAEAFLNAAEQAYCRAMAQTAASAQPLLGILIAHGEAAPGIPSRSGTAGPHTRGDAGFRIGAVHVRLPDVRRQQTAAIDQFDHTAYALSGSVSLPLFPGVPAAGMTGIGAVRAVATATGLPFDVLRLPGLADDAAKLAWGAGAVVDVLGESRMIPALALSVMHRRLGRVSYGTVCPEGARLDLITGRGSGYDFVAGTCASPGDEGEVSFDLSSWSGRAVVAKRLAAIRLAAGAGYDRYSSDVNFGLGATGVVPGLGERPVYVRASGLELVQGRWSTFLNGSMPIRRGGIVAEAGWLQGGSVVEGFDSAASAFDPTGGAVFGSVGVRIAF